MRIHDDSNHPDARENERQSVRVERQADPGGGGPQRFKFRSQRGADRSSGRSPARRVVDNGVGGDVSGSLLSRQEVVARLCARGSAAYRSIERMAGSLRLDSSAQQNLQQCKQVVAERDARVGLCNTPLFEGRVVVTR